MKKRAVFALLLLLAAVAGAWTAGVKLHAAADQVTLTRRELYGRADAARADITDIDQKNGALLFTVPRFDLRQVSALCGGEKYKGRLLFSAGEKPYLSLKLKKGENVLRAARTLVADYAAGLEETGA